MTTVPLEIFWPDFDSSDDRTALQELAAGFGRLGAITDVARFAEAMQQREEQQRTWLGRRTALPHARIAGVSQLSLILARHRTGLVWGTPDQRAHLFFCVAVPPNAGVDYLHLTQRITRTLRDPRRYQALLAATDESDLSAAWHVAP